MYTYFNAVLNLSRRQRGRLETGQIRPQEYAAAMAWIFVMVPIAEWLMFGDDDEPAAEALARDIPSYYLGQ